LSSCRAFAANSDAVSASLFVEAEGCGVRTKRGADPVGVVLRANFEDRSLRFESTLASNLLKEYPTNGSCMPVNVFVLGRGTYPPLTNSELTLCDVKPRPQRKSNDTTVTLEPNTTQALAYNWERGTFYVIKIGRIGITEHFRFVRRRSYQGQHQDKIKKSLKCSY
jgi:hypothetical protein